MAIARNRSRHSNVFFEIASKFRSCTQVFFRKTILKDWALFSWKNPSVLFTKFTSSKPKILFKKVSALGIFGNSMQVFRQVVSRNTSMSVVKIRREHSPDITLENSSSKIFEKISISWLWRRMISWKLHLYLFCISPGRSYISTVSS